MTISNSLFFIPIYEAAVFLKKSFKTTVLVLSMSTPSQFQTYRQSRASGHDGLRRWRLYKCIILFVRTCRFLLIRWNNRPGYSPKWKASEQNIHSSNSQIVVTSHAIKSALWLEYYKYTDDKWLKMTWKFTILPSSYALMCGGCCDLFECTDSKQEVKVPWKCRYSMLLAERSLPFEAGGRGHAGECPIGDLDYWQPHS